MHTNAFTVGSPPPLIRDAALFYTVSGERLQDTEVIQVVVRLPFCLYIPPSRYLFPDPGTRELLGFVPEKVWTERAKGSTVLAAEPEISTETVYFSNSEFTTDWIGTPEQFTSGPTGRNVEFDKDPTGYFRYTRLTIEMDWKVPENFDPYRDTQGRKFDVIEQILLRTVDIANHIIDVYRLVTEDAYVRRVSYLMADAIRIGIPDNCSIRTQEKLRVNKFTYKCGYHPGLSSSQAIRSAIVNKPLEVIEAFRSLLASGSKPETYRLLELNADAALEQRDSKLAVLESFLALEVYVERFYRSRLNGTMDPTAIERLLTQGDNWRLKVRLKKLLKDQFSRSVAEMDNRLWEDWLGAHEKRSDLVHRNIEPTLEHAHKIGELNKAIIHLLETM